MFNKLVMSCLKSVLWYHNSNFVIEIANCFFCCKWVLTICFRSAFSKEWTSTWNSLCVMGRGCSTSPSPCLLRVIAQGVSSHSPVLSRCSDFAFEKVFWLLDKMECVRNCFVEEKKYCCLVPYHDSYAGVFRTVEFFAGCKNSWDKSSLTSVNHVNLSYYWVW